MDKSVEVKSVRDDVVTVGCSDVACGGCKGSLFCTNKAKVFEALNPSGIPLEKGDRVKIHIPEGKAVLTVIITFLVPLALFYPTFLLGGLITDIVPLQTLFGLMGIAAGFLISWLFFRGRKREYSPTVTGILEEETSEDPNTELNEEDEKIDAGKGAFIS